MLNRFLLSLICGLAVCFAIGGYSQAADEPLARMYEAFASGLSACLRAEFPAAPAARCRSTAFAIVCLGMSRSQLTELGVSQRHTQGLRSSAEVLIDSLRRG